MAEESISTPGRTTVDALQLRACNGGNPVFTAEHLRQLSLLRRDQKAKNPACRVWLNYKPLEDISKELPDGAPISSLSEYATYHYEPLHKYPPSFPEAQMMQLWMKCLEDWESTAARLSVGEQLLGAFPDMGSVSKMCCFGLGSMTETNDASGSPFVKHMAAKKMAERIQALSQTQLEIVFVDQIYAETPTINQRNDLTFLNKVLKEQEDWRLKIIVDPAAGIREITRSTFVLAFSPPPRFISTDPACPEKRDTTVQFPVRQMIENYVGNDPQLMPAAILCAPPDFDNQESGDRAGYRVEEWLGQNYSGTFSGESSALGHTCLYVKKQTGD
ncbi:hypothetical protein K505DRAFT_393859 [Melanomma pulvis-pyrius CBS 109.77]|uniref:Uncharacterized protein n=1 Tax=Melanomma pulvis-pyrius CBS 109.77 TaxID=1314802 RepID=A0A6A6XSE7_9PLEO|nr:hypothetical protein K505DRAFT_393859 [Melanomma pulvis-pyrius CBS 109.77]